MPFGRRTAALIGGVAFALGIGARLLWMGSPAAEPTAPALEAAAPAASMAGVELPPVEVVEAPSVQVAINATPWATVRIDGREVGVTPLSGVKLTPGPHSFEAQLPDGRVVTREVVIDADNRFVVFP